MNRFQPPDKHTVTPRIITPTPEALVGFVKHVFDATGDFHPNRPSEIRIGDSVIMISDGDGRRLSIGGQLRRGQSRLSRLRTSTTEIGARWCRTRGAIFGRLLHH